MQRKSVKKLLALLLSVCLIVSVEIPAMGAADDLKGHWAEYIMKEWAAEGLLTGDGNGAYRPDDTITRAEFATFVNHLKGYQTPSGDIANYLDVSAERWYYGEIAAALQAGYMAGTSETAISPEIPVTREQAMTMVSKIINVTPNANTAVLAQANDGDAVSPWARESVAAVMNEGLISGFAGNLNPRANITRAESVALLNNVRLDARAFAFPGIFGVSEGARTVGSVSVTAPDVVLQNMTVRGNLTIEKTVGDGAVRLTNLAVNGRTTIAGGGMNSVYFDHCTLKEIVVAKDNVRLVLDGASSVETVRASGRGNMIEMRDGTAVETLTITGDRTAVFADAATVIETLNAEADGTRLETQAGTTIETANLNGQTTINGEGSVGKANISAEGVSIETTPADTTVSKGISGSVGGENVTGSGSGGKGGGVTVNNSGGGRNNSSNQTSDQEESKPTPTPAPVPVFLSHNAPNKSVPYGTAFSAVGLPATVQLIADTGAIGTASVLWTAGGYLPETAGNYTVVGKLSGATVAWAPETITVKVTVGNPLTAQAKPIPDITVPSTLSESDVIADKLPDVLSLTLSDGSVIQVPATWAVSGAYSQEKEAENVFTATLSNVPKTVKAPVITVKVIIAEQDAAYAQRIEISASPLRVTPPDEVTLSAAVYDQYGEPYAGETVGYYLVEEDPLKIPGCSLAGATLTITAEAEALTQVAVGVHGTDPAFKSEMNVMITTEPIEVASVDIIEPATELFIPAEGKTTTETFKAVVEDSDGFAITGETATWSIEPAVTGVSVVSGTGVVTVQPAAQEGSFTLVATNGAFSKQAVVKLLKAESIATTLGIDDSDLTIPFPVHALTGETAPSKKVFTAHTIDQYGEPMSPIAVAWSLKSAVSGVTMSPGGELSVAESTAASSAVIVVKLSGFADAEATVRIEKDDPVATVVTLAAEGALLLPETYLDETAKSLKQYTPTLYDQYNQPIAITNVDWSMSPSIITGVSLEKNADGVKGDLTVTKGAPVDTPFKINATVTGATGAKTVIGSKDVRVEKGELRLVEITVTGPATMLPNQSAQFTATGKDQYGDGYDVGDAVWDVTGETPGEVTVDAEGLVTTVNAADEAEFTVTAVLGGITGGSQTVTVVADTFIPSDVTFKIDGTDLMLAWTAPSVASDGYIVYTMPGSGSWDEGVFVEDEEIAVGLLITAVVDAQIVQGDYEFKVAAYFEEDDYESPVPVFTEMLAVGLDATPLAFSDPIYADGALNVTGTFDDTKQYILGVLNPEDDDWTTHFATLDIGETALTAERENSCEGKDVFAWALSDQLYDKAEGIAPSLTITQTQLAGVAAGNGTEDVVD